MRTTKTTQATREQIEKANNAWTMAKAARFLALEQCDDAGIFGAARRARIDPLTKAMDAAMEAYYAIAD